MVAGSERVDEEELQMRTSAALVTTSTLPLSLTPARAELYPTLPCRVFVDTGYTRFQVNAGRCDAHTAHKLFTLATREFPSGPRGSCRIAS
jgi:hypothetical protein